MRVGCSLVYETSAPTFAVLNVRPRRLTTQWVQNERTLVPQVCPPEEIEDAFGNFVTRIVLAPGRSEIRHDALVAVSSTPEASLIAGAPAAVSTLSLELLRYTLPSRYCDSDSLRDFAWQNFGHITHGAERVKAICDWIHNNIRYTFGQGRPIATASDVVRDGFGVCRDFAHVGIALCRAFNLPARYVCGHLPDIGCIDAGGPMDFHAYFEVFLGDRWHVCDPRFNAPRIGRIKISHGLDAVDVAFATLYGQAQLQWFEVWAYQVDPQQVAIGDPIDLTKRLDSSLVVRAHRAP